MNGPCRNWATISAGIHTISVWSSSTASPRRPDESSSVTRTETSRASFGNPSSARNGGSYNASLEMARPQAFALRGRTAPEEYPNTDDDPPASVIRAARSSIQSREARSLAHFSPDNEYDLDQPP